MSILLCLSFLITCYCADAQQQSLQCGSVTFSKLSFDTTVRSSLLPAGRLVYVPLEQIVGGDICRLASSARPLFTYPFTNYQQIVTICANCTTCSVGLPAIYAYLQRMLVDVRVSLVVLVRSTNNHRLLGGTTGGATANAAAAGGGGGGGGTNTVSTEAERKVRLAFVDDEMPLKLDDCQIVDVGDGDALRSFSKTSVLFVSISFIILMVISLAWLVFYYVQRFRYAHAKDRLQRRLFNAAKKALTRIPTRSIKIGDKELEADCPVCIDPYHTGDVVRSLPCRHIFHKTCVDPWLLEHRTCPMCKSDILKAFGYHVNVGRRTPVNAHRDNPRPAAVTRDADRLSIDVHSTGSDSVLPIPIAVNETAHQHGIYSATMSVSPQIVQVMHCSNRNAFTIVPLTMHSECPSNHIKCDANQPSHTAQSDESRLELNNRVVTWLPTTTSEHHSLNAHHQQHQSARTANLSNVRSQSLTQLDLAPPLTQTQQQQASQASNLIAGRVTSSRSMRGDKPSTIIPARTLTEPHAGQPEGIGTCFTAYAVAAAPSSVASQSCNNIGDTRVTVRSSSARFSHQTTFNRQRVCSLKDNNTRPLNDCMASVESL